MTEIAVQAYADPVSAVDTRPAGGPAMGAQEQDIEERLREEIELARALTAVLLAARLEVAEANAQIAMERIAGRLAHARSN